MEKTLLIIFFIEHVILFWAFILFYLRKRKYWKKQEQHQEDFKRYLFRLQPNPAFEKIKTPQILLDQKTFIESPEVGVYLKRLYEIADHKHGVVQALLYITKGKAQVIMGDKKMFVKPGDFLHVPANVNHVWNVIKPDKYVEYIEIANPSFAFTCAQDTIWEESVIDEK